MRGARGQPLGCAVWLGRAYQLQERKPLIPGGCTSQGVLWDARSCEGESCAPGTPPAVGTVAVERGSSAWLSDAPTAGSADLAPAEGKGRAGVFEIQWVENQPELDFREGTMSRTTTTTKHWE